MDLGIDLGHLLEQWGPPLGGIIVVVLLFVFTLLRILGLHSRSDTRTAKAIELNAKAMSRFASTNAAQTEVIRAQPDRWCLAQLKISDGGFLDEEVEEIRGRVRAAEEAMESLLTDPGEEESVA